MVYTELKVPFSQAEPAERPAQRHQLEIAERALDGRWRASLKRCLLDGKNSGLFRLQRPCVAAVPGPFPELNPMDIFELMLELETGQRPPMGCVVHDDLTTMSNALWPIDHFRDRLQDIIAQFCGESRKGPTLNEWLGVRNS